MSVAAKRKRKQKQRSLARRYSIVPAAIERDRWGEIVGLLVDEVRWNAFGLDDSEPILAMLLGNARPIPLRRTPAGLALARDPGRDADMLAIVRAGPDGKPFATPQWPSGVDNDDPIQETCGVPELEEFDDLPRLAEFVKELGRAPPRVPNRAAPASPAIIVEDPAVPAPAPG